MKRIGLGLAIILFASLFGCCISDVGDTTKSDETPSTKPVETHKKEPKYNPSNPGPMGDPIVVETSSGTFEITVTDAIRGGEVEGGYEYIFIKVKFKYKSGKTPYYKVSPRSFKVYSNKVGYSSTLPVLFDNHPKLFRDVSLMPGGEVEGWIPFIVPKNKDFLIAYENISEPVCFIKITSKSIKTSSTQSVEINIKEPKGSPSNPISDVGDTTKSDKTSSTQSVETQEPKGSPSNPASVGEPVVVETSSKTFEITVTDAIRGEKAYQIRKSASSYLNEPKDGYEYLLVKVRFKYKSGKKLHYVSVLHFKAYCGGVGYDYESTYITDDYPSFETFDLMPGGEIEGWIVYKVPKDKNVLIAYEYRDEPVCFIRI